MTKRLDSEFVERLRFTEAGTGRALRAAANWTDANPQQSIRAVEISYVAAYTTVCLYVDTKTFIPHPEGYLDET